MAAPTTPSVAPFSVPSNSSITSSIYSSNTSWTEAIVDVLRQEIQQTETKEAFDNENKDTNIYFVDLPKGDTGPGLTDNYSIDNIIESEDKENNIKHLENYEQKHITAHKLAKPLPQCPTKKFGKNLKDNSKLLV